LDCNPTTVIGLDVPTSVNVPGEDITVYEVTGGCPAGYVNETICEPLLNGLFVPTSTAVGLFGTDGIWKSPAN
jgi:hypothetical protein